MVVHRAQVDLVAEHLRHLLERLPLGLGEEQGDDDEVDGVEADEENVVPPADVLDREVGHLGEQDVEEPVGAGGDWRVIKELVGSGERV